MIKLTLKLLRLMHRLTPEALANEVQDLTAAEILDYESGQTEPGLNVLRIYAALFSCPVSSLLRIAEDLGTMLDQYCDSDRETAVEAMVKLSVVIGDSKLLRALIEL